MILYVPSHEYSRRLFEQAAGHSIGFTRAFRLPGTGKLLLGLFDFQLGTSHIARSKDGRAARQGG